MSVARKFLLYILYACALAGLIVLIIFATHSKTDVSKPKVAKTQTTQKAQTKPKSNPSAPATSPTAASSGAAATQPAATPSAASPTTDSSSAATTTNSATTQLVNTGPGDVLVLFAVASIVGAIVGYRYQVHRVLAADR